MIGLEGIKIEEDRMSGVQDWSTPNYAKDVQNFLELTNYYY